MDNQRSTELRVGFVTLVSLLLLIVGLVLGKGLWATTSLSSVRVFVSSSGGADVSSPVVINGVKRGAITGITPVQGGVIITASIDNTKDLRKDAFARITMLEITGGKKVEIFTGTSNEAFQPTDTIRGINTGDIADMIALVSELGADAQRIVKKLDTIATAGTQLLADGKVVRDARKTLDQLSALSVTANELIQNNRGKIQTVVNDVNDLTGELRRAVKTNSPKIDRLVTQLDSTLVEAKRLLATGDKTVKNVDGLVSDVDGLIRDVQQRDSFVHRLLYDEAFNKRLDSTLISVRAIFEGLPTNGVNVNVRLGTRP